MEAPMERKGILKSARRLSKIKGEDGSTTQSSSIGAVRWDLPEEMEQPYSSAPSRPSSSSAKDPQQHARQSGLKELRSLQECVQFIHHWKEQVEQVEQVCKHGGGQTEGSGQKGAARSDRHTERSLEESRKLILEWAEEVQHVDRLLRRTHWTPDSPEHESKEEKDAQMQIMEWAKELQTATESCGVESDKLLRVVHLLSQKKKLLVRLAPLLEFITWSLLRQDCRKKIPQVWLLAKQKTWKAGIPRYIPNSVWSWICSAAADVVLDPMTSHPWLQLSDDRRQVQEGRSPSEPPRSSQRFDGWPAVLAWEGYGGGRRYWEVDIANKGYWRVGLTTAESKRLGHFPMSPKEGYWVLWRSPHHFYACSKPETELPPGLAPRRLGVYVDYEEGQISFYNAEAKSHIYTFTGAFRGKLYPLFAPMDGHTLMTIMEPHKISGN